MTASRGDLQGPANLLDALESSIRKAGDHVPGQSIAPAAVLWSDDERDCEGPMPLLLARLPGFLVLGPYQPKRTGPGIWIKCVLAATLEEARLAPGMPARAMRWAFPGSGRGRPASPPRYLFLQVRRQRGKRFPVG